MNVLLTGFYPQGVTGLAPFYLKAYHMARSKYKDHSQITVKGRDLNASNDEIIADICRHSPDMVGFSCYIWNIQKTFQVCEALRKRLPKTIIILGGPEVSPSAIHIMKNHSYIDFIVSGEGEVTFSELLDHFAGSCSDLNSIDGITFRYRDHCYQTRQRRLIPDLSEIPSPFLDHIVDFSQFKGYLFGFETFRGCPYLCSYCYWGRMQQVRFFPMGRIEKELAIILHSSIRRVWLSDSVANLNASRFKTFLRTIISSGSRTIFDFEMVSELLDEETIELLGQLHDGYIAFGLQSTNPPALSGIERKWNKDKFEKNIRLLRQHTDKVKIYIDIIYGLPGDNMKTYVETSSYAMSLLPQKIQPHPLLILPGSPFFDEPGKYDIVYQTDPPHQALQSNTFSPADMDAAAEWSNMLFFYFNPCVSTTVIMLSQILNHNAIDVFRRLLDSVGPGIDLGKVSTDTGIEEEHALNLLLKLQKFIEQELGNRKYLSYAEPLSAVISFLTYKTMFYLTGSPHSGIVDMGTFDGEGSLKKKPVMAGTGGIPIPRLNPHVVIQTFPFDITVLYNENILKLPEQLLKIKKSESIVVFNFVTHSIYRITSRVRQLLELCDGRKSLPQIYEGFLLSVDDAMDRSAAYRALDSTIVDMFRKSILTVI